MRKPLTRQNSTRDKRRYSAYQNRIFFYLVTLVTAPLLLLGVLSSVVYYRQTVTRSDALLASARENVETVKRSSNNVIDFMESEGYFRFKADYSISSKEFYDIYKQWCEDNACHSVSAIRFSAELRQNDRRYNLEATNNIYLPGGRRVRGFVGIEPLVHPCP